MAGKIGNKFINLTLQAHHLKMKFPESTVRVKRSCLRWEGVLLPTPLSDLYTVRVTYKLKKSPRVNILKPELLIPEGKSLLPHTYSEKRLCLYFPGSKDWSGNMLLSKTIIPWISEWLYFYELWLVTGEWYGGGIHPKKHL
jgi:hypothetical protein